MSASPAPESWDAHLLRELERHKPEELLKALSETSDLSCQQALELLPLLIEAEQAGQDTDAMPEFAALLRHLDTCEACMARYVQLADEADAVKALLEAPPAEPQLAAPALITVRESADVVLSKLRGVANWFRLQLTLPALPLPSGLSSAQGLFGDTVTEVDAQPVVSVSLGGAGELCDVLVVAQADAPVRWRVHLTLGGVTRSAPVDADGLAHFEAIPRAELQRLTLTFEPLPDEPSAPPT
jgi:hypothetical protein